MQEELQTFSSNYVMLVVWLPAGHYYPTSHGMIRLSDKEISAR